MKNLMIIIATIGLMFNVACAKKTIAPNPVSEPEPTASVSPLQTKFIARTISRSTGDTGGIAYSKITIIDQTINDTATATSMIYDSVSVNKVAPVFVGQPGHSYKVVLHLNVGAYINPTEAEMLVTEKGHLLTLFPALPPETDGFLNIKVDPGVSTIFWSMP